METLCTIRKKDTKGWVNRRMEIVAKAYGGLFVVEYGWLVSPEADEHWAHHNNTLYSSKEGNQSCFDKLIQMRTEFLNKKTFSFQ